MSLFKSKIYGGVLVLGLLGIGVVSQTGKNTEKQAEQVAVTPKTKNIVRNVTEDQHNTLTASAVSALSSSITTTTNKVKQTKQPAEDDALSALIGNAISELGSLAEEENNYISALTGTSKIHGGDADHLNKIDFSSLTIQKKRPVQSFETQMDALVGNLLGAESATNKPSASVVKNALPKAKLKTTAGGFSEDGNVASYIASLATEAETRRNEVRMITVTPGETLWIIAARAYGDGNLYKKIYTANPHIKNPNMIEIGDVLRVPI